MGSIKKSNVVKCLIICFFSLFFSYNVSAIDYDESGSSNITACSMLVGSSNLIGTTTPTGGCIWVPNSNGWATRVVLDLSTPIPGKALVTVSGRFANDANIGFIGFPGSSTLTPISSNTTINEGQDQLSFQYIFYTSSNLNSLRFQGDLWYVNSGKTRVDISNIQFVTLTSEPTRQQMVALQNSINEINSKTATTNSNLELIRGKLDEIISNSDRTADSVEEQNEREKEADSNIENQSSSDIQNSESEQTTSLIGVLSNFLSAFQGVSATNCQLDVPFPDFLGGNTSVDVCQGKDKAPALIAAGSSLLLILTFIPLAYIMLRMIYNEIRSFTNG